MGVKSFITVGLLAIAASALPQTASETGSAGSSTSVSPAQSSEFRAALNSYYSSFRSSPQYTGLGLALALQPNGDQIISSISANPSVLLPITGSSIDLVSLATDPPLTFPTLAFYSGLDSEVVSSIQALQTSAALQIASIDQSVLGTTASLSTPTPTASSSSQDGAGAAIAAPTGMMAMGAAVGALGAAVVML